MKIYYAPEFITDLERLRAFIAEYNPQAAQRIAGELLEGINRLKIFPKMGLPAFKAPQPEDIRDLYIGQYTVRYLLAGNRIYILRIWHNKEGEKTL